MTTKSKRNQEYITRYRENNDSKALEILLLSNFDIISQTVDKFIDSGIEYDELLSIATEGAINAIKYIDYNNIGLLRGYIVNYASAYIKREIKEKSKFDFYVSLEEYNRQHKNDQDNFSYDEFFKNYSNMLSYEAIISFLPYLNEKQQRIIKARYGIDDGNFKTLEEVGKMYNCCRETIRKHEAKAIKKIRGMCKINDIKYY